MRPLALLLILAAPAWSAEELELRELDPKETLAFCLSRHTDVRNYVHGYYRDEESRLEFQRLYAAFTRTVGRRRNEGWSNGALGNQKTNWINAWRRYNVLALFRNAPQWEGSRSELEREYASAAEPARKRELKAFMDSRFGVCNDWQQEIAAALRAAQPRKFAVHERVLEGSTAGSSHAYVLVCPKDDPSHCVAFDPWKRGLPELYTDNEASQGPSAGGCFRNDRPDGT